MYIYICNAYQVKHQVKMFPSVSEFFYIKI